MPKVELKETVGCTKKFRVEIEQERLEQEIHTTVKKLKRDVQIPGFRKGKAPESLILRRFGPTIRQEAVRDMIPKVLQEVFDAEGIVPINDPDVTDLNFGETGPISFTVAIEELPAIDVSGFEGLAVTREVREVTDNDVENEIERLLRMYARQEEVDRGARNGDILVVNLQKLDFSGVPIIGEKIENHVVLLDGQNTPSPEFDEQVLGMVKGDSKTVRFTYDETINNPELVGKNDAYDVQVIRVLEYIIPDLDDEFVKSLGEFQNADDFRSKTRTRLERQFDANTEQNLKGDLMKEFVDQHPFEVPNGMVASVIQSEIDRIRQSNPDAQFDENDYRSQMRPDAVRAVQTFIVIEAVKKHQNIEVEQEELAERIEVLAELNGMESREFRRKLIKEGSLDELKNNIARDMTYKWMIDVADVTDKTVTDDSEESRIIRP